MAQTFNGSYEHDRTLLRDALRVERSFDLLEREIMIGGVGGKRASLYFVDAFVKDEIIEKMFEFLMKLDSQQVNRITASGPFSSHFLSYVEVNREAQLEPTVTAVLIGTAALIVEGYDQVFLIDARTYPARSVDEPQDDRVLRGSHDGFVETLLFNTALIRRRVRDPRLTMEALTVGTKSKTDVVLCYMDGICDQAKLDTLRKKLQSITIPALALGQESLLECLCRRRYYNPFPKVRYTERPDTAAASVMEGKILLMVDNSPSVMILPTGFFDFLQDTNDYYFPPIVGSYLRLLRGAVFFLTLFLTPFWYLLLKNPAAVPAWLQFLTVAEPNTVPIIVQLLLVELIIDIIRLASLNTPSALNNAFGVVGALILGEFAVNADLFVPEVLLYMAFVAVSAFAQPSYEMGYAFKLYRILFLVLTALFNVWGFAAGVLLMLAMLACVQTPLGRCYLYPLIPFDGEALHRLLLRRPISRHNA